MLDPWPIAIETLFGAHLVPAVRWPAARTRIVKFIEPDSEPDLELPPEPVAPRTTSLDEAVLAGLQAAGVASVRDLAAELGQPRQTVWRRLRQLSAQGQVHLAPNGWRPTQAPGPGGF